MKNPLVVVGISHVDASTENVHPSLADNGIWIFNLPMAHEQMAEHAVQQLDAKVRDNIHTAITCSSADDSYARYRSVIQSRARPRDVLAALGVNFASILKDHLPNVQNIFKAEAACASGLIALELADMIARTHDAVVLIAAADKSTAPIFLNLFYYIKAVATHPGQYYSPFDQQRAGFAMGEGAAMLAVTTADQARIRGLSILATVDSVKTQTIFTHPTSPSESGLLEQFIKNVLVLSSRPLVDFACWDAHATATPHGDETEYEIFANIFNNTDTAISSFKGRVGHCMSASSVIETVNAIKHLQKNKISPTHNLVRPIVNDTRLITDVAQTTKKTFIKTSFGFGGRNGAAVITVE
jgi:3-oxoacyl-(acyl-carrier-protein) synthase